MVEDCKTESEYGSVTQSWDWAGSKKSGQSMEALAKASAQDFPASSWAGDSLWRNPVRTCAPELFTISRLGTITLGESLAKYGVHWWEDQRCGIWDAPALSMALPLGDSGRILDLVSYLDSVQGLVSATKFQESVTLWSLFWIYLNAQAKIIDSSALWLYTNSKDSGEFSESLVFDSIQGLVSGPKLVETQPILAKPWFVEWIKLWDRIFLAAAPGFIDKGALQEFIKFNSVRYKSESGKIWEYVIFFGGYGVGSGYGLGEYGK